MNLTELQQKKYDERLNMGKFWLKLQSGRRIGGEEALESTLESAASEKREILGRTFANHSASLPFEALEAMAEELLAFCQWEYSEEDCAYLRTSVERFFQKNSPKPAKQEANTRKWALFYWYIREIGELREIDSGIKKGLYALAREKNVSGNKMYKIFNAVNNKDDDLNPMKANILEQVIPLLIDYPKAQSMAESDYQSIMNRGE